jgi:flagellar hook-basal body complex protein FliE
MNIGNMGASGDIVRLAVSQPGHLSGKVHEGEDKLDPQISGQSFTSVLANALTETSDLEQSANALSQQFITDPESVDVHDVTIALGKANLAVSVTKSVVDGALKAYREIINIR